MEKKHAEEVMSLRSGALEFASIALVLALGVNLISGAIGSAFSRYQIYVLLSGLFLVFLGIVFVIFKFISSSYRKYNLRGVQFFDGDPRSAVRVHRYKFSESSFEYYKAIGSENRAIMKICTEGPLFHSNDGGAMEEVKIETPAQRIQKELVEYFLLKSLSLHLGTYFGEDDSDEKFLSNIGRRDIPGFLLDNRFLELFSRPMEDREAFSSENRKAYIEKVGPDGSSEIVSAYGKGGEIYERFELTLPKNTKLTRQGGNLVIKTPRFTMTANAEFEGFSTYIPREFCKYYMSNDWMKLEKYLVVINIDVKFGLISMFTPSGWRYYQWLDSFLDRLKREFSFDDFLDNIGWSSALTSAMILSGMQREAKGRNLPAVKAADRSKT